MTGAGSGAGMDSILSTSCLFTESPDPGGWSGFFRHSLHSAGYSQRIGRRRRTATSRVPGLCPGRRPSCCRRRFRLIIFVEDFTTPDPEAARSPFRSGTVKSRPLHFVVGDSVVAGMSYRISVRPDGGGQEQQAV